MKPKIVPELNRLYISAKCYLPNFSHRKMNGYTYMDNGIVLNSGLQPIHRYAQDFKINKQEVCLILLTKDPDESKVEDWFKKVKKKVKVTKKQTWGSPTKLDIYFKGYNEDNESTQSK